jgi:hypothetical protein
MKKKFRHRGTENTEFGTGRFLKIYSPKANEPLVPRYPYLTKVSGPNLCVSVVNFSYVFFS